MKQEMMSLLHTEEVPLECNIADDKATDDDEEHRIVEVFVDHIVLVVGSDANKEHIVAPSEHLRGRLESSGERPQIVQIFSRERV